MQRKLDHTQEEVRVLKEILAALTGSRTISLLHCGSAASPGHRRQGVEPRRAEEVLPDREAWNDLGVVSADGGAEVRQLESEGRSTSEEEGHSQAGDRYGPGKSGLGTYENPRRPSHECLNHFVIFGERHLRHLIKEFVEHYMTERFHQGIGGQLIRNVGPTNDNGADGKVACRSRLGGLLNFYHREAA
jgi:hypothetical protein